eukprot:5481192-Alexandrium_andersonii.AAC.1
MSVPFQQLKPRALQLFANARQASAENDRATIVANGMIDKPISCQLHHTLERAQLTMLRRVQTLG